MRSIFLLLTLLITTSCLLAQNRWQHLANNGIRNASAMGARYEDIYFTDTSNGYAITLLGEIFRTRDGGRNWITALDQISRMPSLRSIEFLDDRATGFCGSLSVDNAFLTFDSGKTWSNIGAQLPDTIFYGRGAICGVTHTDSTFYATGAWFSHIARFYKGTDHGRKWTVRYLDSSLISSGVDICFTSHDTGYIAGGYAPGIGPSRPSICVVMKTTDGGTSWRRVFYDTTINGRIWKLQALGKNMLVGAVEPYFTPSQPVSMIRSDDGGESWRVIKTGFNRNQNTQISQATTQGVCFVDSLRGWIGGYYQGLYETVDGGGSWRYDSFGSMYNRFFVLDPEHVYAGGREIYFFGRQRSVPAQVRAPFSESPAHRLEPVRPNPTRGKVQIRFELLSQTQVQLEIANMDGRRSWTIFRGPLGKGKYDFEWDGTSAPAGNYIVWLGTNQIPITATFSIVK